MDANFYAVRKLSKAYKKLLLPVGRNLRDLKSKYEHHWRPLISPIIPQSSKNHTLKDNCLIL